MSIRINLKRAVPALILALGAVFFWRGVWGLLDVYLFPNNMVLSYSISIGIGIVVLYFIRNLLEPLKPELK